MTELTVDQIMHDRGVGKRYAYTLLRREQAKRMEGHVPQNQRNLLLRLLSQDTTIRNSDDLSEAAHAAGSKLPPHDVTKTLWSLQKSQYVRFRERANGMLYGISLTGQGWAAAKEAIITPQEIKEVALHDVSIVKEPPVPTWVVTAREVEAVLDAGVETGEITPEARESIVVQPDEPAVPWFRGNMGGWPSMRDVRDRHQKAVKIKAALALLEEVGEDDVVLGLLDKITFTPLEDEVIQLLRFLKEIPE